MSRVVPTASSLTTSSGPRTHSAGPAETPRDSVPSRVRQGSSPLGLWQGLNGAPGPQNPTSVQARRHSARCPVSSQNLSHPDSGSQLGMPIRTIWDVSKLLVLLPSSSDVWTWGTERNTGKCSQVILTCYTIWTPQPRVSVPAAHLPQIVPILHSGP